MQSNLVNSIELPRWFDRHLHLRSGDMLRNVLPCTLSELATGAVIMGNLNHPDETSTIARTVAYRAQIQRAIENHFAPLPLGGPKLPNDFNPRMTCYLTDTITPEEVVRGFKEGAWCAVKLYIAGQGGVGGTTNSGHGVKDLPGRYPVFEAMEAHGIPLLGHFEAVEKSVDEFDREMVSIDRDLMPIILRFPKLPIVFEHITDGRAAEFVATSGCNIQATVTAHHLVLNRNDMFWGGMNPIHYCKPVPKREEHRAKVRQYVTSGNKRFGAGTDSAPHDISKKTLYCGCAAGIFTAPCAVELYTSVFAEDNALEHLGAFLSENFIHLYGMEVSSERMIVKRAPFKIPDSIGGVKVFRGGTELPWKLEV